MKESRRKLPVTRVLELERPSFTWEEKKELMSGSVICMFGVEIFHLAENWFRLEASDYQSMKNVIGILKKN